MPDLSELPSWTFVALKVAVILAAALVLSRLGGRIIRRVEKHITDDDEEGLDALIQAKRAQTLGGVLRTALIILVWALASLTALDQVGVDIRPLIAAAGIGGLALGFGAQNLVRDFIAGFFILFEKQYDVGDVVRIVNVAGAVEEVKLRTTVLRDLEGVRHVIPNGEIRVSSNLTKGFSRYVIVLPVPYDADVDVAIDIAREATEVMRQEDDFRDLILAPLEVLGMDNYGESQIDVKVYVETTPGKQWQVGRELRRRIKLAFDKAGISIPFPHREIIVRNAQDGGGSSFTGDEVER
jgi:small-conductance mechanosensitive channel